MTTKELHNKLGQLLKNEKLQDYEIFIPTQGMCYSGVPLKSATVGFDWTANKICLNTEPRLAQLDSNKYHKYKKLALLKLSNLRTLLGQYNGPFIAKFKKEQKEFEKRIDAIEWLYEKLDEECKKVVV